MNEFPRRLKLFWSDYEVRLLDRVEAEACGVWGRISQRLKRIEISENATSDQQAETLLHEILHRVSDTYYPQQSDEDEEVIVSRFAPGLATIMRDNPEAFRWILDALAGG